MYLVLQFKSHRALGGSVAPDVFWLHLIFTTECFPCTV